MVSNPVGTLSARWHGAPVWVWAAGGTVLAAGAVYVYRKRKAAPASSATTDTTGTADPQQGYGGGVPFPGAGSYLPPGSGDATAQQQSLVDQLTKVGADAVTAITTAASNATSQQTSNVGQVSGAGNDAVKAINDAATSAVASITQATQVSMPAPAAPVPVASVPSAPPPPAAAPAPSTPVGWQEALGLSPAPAGQTAVPVYASDNTVIGERFTGVSTEPKPWNIIDNPPPPDQVRQSIYGPVTLAQYNLLRPDQRL